MRGSRHLRPPGSRGIDRLAGRRPCGRRDRPEVVHARRARRPRPARARWSARARRQPADCGPVASASTPATRRAVRRRSPRRWPATWRTWSSGRCRSASSSGTGSTRRFWARARSSSSRPRSAASRALRRRAPSCSASDVRLGVALLSGSLPGARLDPWLGVGVGVEVLNARGYDAATARAARVELVRRTSSRSSRRGWTSRCRTGSASDRGLGHLRAVHERVGEGRGRRHDVSGAVHGPRHAPLALGRPEGDARALRRRSPASPASFRQRSATPAAMTSDAASAHGLPGGLARAEHDRRLRRDRRELQPRPARERELAAPRPSDADLLAPEGPRARDDRAGAPPPPGAKPRSRTGSPADDGSPAPPRARTTSPPRRRAAPPRSGRGRRGARARAAARTRAARCTRRVRSVDVRPRVAQLEPRARPSRISVRAARRRRATTSRASPNPGTVLPARGDEDAAAVSSRGTRRRRAPTSASRKPTWTIEPAYAVGARIPAPPLARHRVPCREDRVHRVERRDREEEVEPGWATRGGAKKPRRSSIWIAGGRAVAGRGEHHRADREEHDGREAAGEPEPLRAEPGEPAAPCATACTLLSERMRRPREEERRAHVRDEHEGRSRPRRARGAPTRAPGTTASASRGRRRRSGTRGSPTRSPSGPT